MNFTIVVSLFDISVQLIIDLSIELTVIKMFFLLLSLFPLISADLKTVALVQSFNLKTSDKSDITCSSIKQVFVSLALLLMQTVVKDCVIVTQLHSLAIVW